MGKSGQNQLFHSRLSIIHSLSWTINPKLERFLFQYDIIPVLQAFGKHMHTDSQSAYCSNLRTIFLIIFMLTGCATQQPISEADRLAHWQLHRGKLAELTRWQFKGRIAIQMEKQGWTASFHWRQDQQDYLLRVFTPLGRGNYEISGNADGAVMQTANNSIVHADDAETLLRDNLGWYIPSSSLKYWVRGLPVPGKKNAGLLLDQKGRLAELSQSGWLVRYSHYINSGEYELPTKIIMQNNNLKIRLVIKHWQTSL